MTKQINFSKKPSRREAENLIDQWVEGANKKEISVKEVRNKRTTIYLPPDLHKELKFYSAQKEISMTTVIIEAVRQYIK